MTTDGDGHWMEQACIQVFLPLRRPDGRPVSREEIDEVKRQLAERHGGVTAYVQAPAEGLWRDAQGLVGDEIVVLEVMTDVVDASWSLLKRELERRFDQKEIAIRASSVRRLCG